MISSSNNQFIETAQAEIKKALDFLVNDLKSLRTNRITTNFVQRIKVEIYGVRTPIEQIASLSILEPRTIVIEPWDKGAIKEIEKAVAEAKLGPSSSLRENKIYLAFPPLTEESRKQVLKILKGKLEDARNSLRLIRNKIKSEIIKAEKEKEISEDEKFFFLEELNKLAAEKEIKIKEIGERKGREIITI